MSRRRSSTEVGAEEATMEAVAAVGEAEQVRT
jgi:hypothetical protein